MLHQLLAMLGLDGADIEKMTGDMREVGALIVSISDNQKVILSKLEAIEKSLEKK